MLGHWRVFCQPLAGNDRAGEEIFKKSRTKYVEVPKFKKIRFDLKI